MEKEKKIKVFKVVVLIITILFIIGITLYLFPVIKNLSTKEGQIAFQEKVYNSGILGLLMLLGLQVAQIFLAILPGEPLEILAGMCYGGFFGTIFIVVSTFITSMVIFTIVRKYGKKFIYYFFDREKVEKVLDSKVFQNSKKVEMFMLIYFLIPGTPKDLIVYVAGLLPIDMMNFLIISTLARFPSVLSGTLAGTQVVYGNWEMVILVYLITIVIVGIIVLIVNKFDKDKITREVLKSLK